MISANSIQAGAAFVRLMADDSNLSQGLNRAQNKFKAFGQSLTSVGTQIQGVFLTPFHALRQGLAVFSGFDDQMRMVKAVSGSTGAAFTMLTEKAKKLGRETAYTAQQVALGMTELGRMGFNAKEIDAATPSVMALASATGTGLADAAGIAANNLRVFGMAASQTGEIADLLTATANGSSQTLIDLGESLKMAGPHARNAGEDVKDVCASLGLLANMGIRGSLAGTALGKSYKRLADPKVAEFLSLYGIRTRTAAGDLRKMRDILVEVGTAMLEMPSADRINFAETVFDARGSLGGGILAQNMAGFDEFVRKLDDSAGVAQKTMQEMESGIGGMKRAFLSAAEGVAVAFGEVLSGPVIKLGKSFTRSLLALRQWIGENSALIRTLASAAAGAATFSIALKTVGMTLGMLGSIAAPLKMIPAAFQALTVSAYSAATAGKVLCTVNTATLASAMRLAAGSRGLAAAFYLKAIAAKTAAGAIGLLIAASNALLAHPVIVGIAAAAAGILLLKHRADALTAALQKAHALHVKIAAQSGAALMAGDENRMENKIARERLKELEELSKKAKLTAAQVQEAYRLLARLEAAGGKGSYGKVENGRVVVNEGAEARSVENDRGEAIRMARKNLRDKNLELARAKAAQDNVINGKRYNLDFWNTSDRRAEEAAAARKAVEKAYREKLDLEKRLRALLNGDEAAITGNAKGEKIAKEQEKAERWIDPAKLAEAKNAASAYEEDNAKKRRGQFANEIGELHKKQKEYEKNIALLLEQEKIELRIAKRTQKKNDTPELRKAIADREKKIAEYEKRLADSRTETAWQENEIRRKQEESEKNYTAFAADAEKENAEREEQRNLRRMKKESPAEWLAKLDGLTKSGQAELDALWKQFHGALKLAKSEDSENGSELSAAERRKLDALQEEIRARQEKLNAWRDELENGRDNFSEKQEKTRTLGSFSGAQLARMIGPGTMAETKKLNFLKRISDATEKTARIQLSYS